jgi:hypothetical protein
MFHMVSLVRFPLESRAFNSFIRSSDESKKTYDVTGGMQKKISTCVTILTSSITTRYLYCRYLSLVLFVPFRVLIISGLNAKAGDILSVINSENESELATKDLASTYTTFELS